jgi:kinetochore protein NDC80
MTFLLRKIDPSFNSSPKRKFEDDVVVAFKVFGYPFNISKTALVAAGSPHTWPTLLLSITWLIEVLEGGSGFDMLRDEFAGIESVGEAGQPFESVEKLEERTEKSFLKYVEISYGSFLSGDDAHFEKLEMELLEYHEKDNMAIEQAIERVMDENIAAEADCTELCKEGGE